MQPGDVVAGRFEVERTAGAGGMGTVYRTRDLTTGEPVALKTIRKPNEEHTRRFLKEAEVLYKLRHPTIVRYVAHGHTETGELFLAMEWLEGENLSQRLKRAALSLNEAYKLALGCAEAIGVAHDRGVLHRDIKPGNIFLVDKDMARVKLVDFGLARAAEASHGLTMTGELLGTPGYMAPEQARGDRDIDPRADVFALGCVLYRCFTGRRAFEGEDALAVLAKLVLEDPPGIKTLRPGIPTELDGLVTRTLAKAREKRPTDGHALLGELLALQNLIDESSLSMIEPVAVMESLPSITVREQRVMCLVLARIDDAAIQRNDDFAAPQVQERVNMLPAAVQPFGGEIEQLIDGTLLVTVGSSTPAEQATRAGRCAVAMRAVLGGVPLALTAGRGIVAKGALLGDAIDRAATLLALGQPGLIRLDDAAAALMRGRFDIERDNDGYVLTGVQYEEEHTRKLLGKPTNCVGRARELRNLEALFEECVSEPVARAVLVTAPAGVGKSRVRHEFLLRLTSRGVVVDEDGDESPFQIWLGRGDPMSAGSAFHIVANAVRQATGVRAGEPLELRRRKLFDRVAQRVAPSEQRRIAEFLGELLGTPFDDEGSVQLRAARNDPMLMGDQMRRAFEDFIATECRREPVLMVLEDLHWGDLPSINFIDAVLRNLRDEPFMVLAFARPEVHELFPNLWAERDLQEIRLSRLTRKACVKLARQVLGKDATDELIERVIGQAEGNAFYLEELIRTVSDGERGKLPESVLAMVQSRMEALDAEGRRVLRAASVFGQVFWRGGVEQLVGKTGAAALDDWLVDLTDREMITQRSESKFPEETEFTFRHSLLREAAYAALTHNDRELGHRLAGSWLEDAGEVQAVVLAEHFERGDDAVHAIGWYRRAAEQALEGNDLEAAVAHAEQGVTCGAEGEPLGQLRLLQADAHRWRGEFAEMESCAGVAMQELPDGTTQWCKAAAELAVACRALGKYDQLVSVAEELSKLIPQREHRAAYVEAAARAAMQLFIIGWAANGDALIARVEQAERSLAEVAPSAVAWIHHARAFGSLFAGDPGAYLQRCEQAASQFERAGDLRSVTNALVHVGFAYIEVGGYRESEVALREALAGAERMGLHNVVATSKHNLGMALARLGALDEAAVVEAEAIRLAVAQADRRMEGASRHYFAIIRALQNDNDQAESDALGAAEALKVAPPLRAHALATVGHIRLAQQRPQEALTVAREAMELLDSLGGIEEGETKVRLVHAEALDATGDHDGACEAISVAAKRLWERASKIKDETWRTSFLEQVPDNARTLALAASWTPNQTPTS
ncbi:MAG: serine/threonine-protein kinase PknK [Deltaproteobacteria bacterium]|nr:MAG: serine/threonine-protein kinase PknK [Deltaproteobacteria bacterium]